MAVGDMMDDLADRPAAGTVGSIELMFIQPCNGGLQVFRCFRNRIDKRTALNIRDIVNGLKFADWYIAGLRPWLLRAFWISVIVGSANRREVLRLRPGASRKTKSAGTPLPSCVRASMKASALSRETGSGTRRARRFPSTGSFCRPTKARSPKSCGGLLHQPSIRSGLRP